MKKIILLTIPVIAVIGFTVVSASDSHQPSEVDKVIITPKDTNEEEEIEPVPEEQQPIQVSPEPASQPEPSPSPEPEPQPEPQPVPEMSNRQLLAEKGLSTEDVECMNTYVSHFTKGRENIDTATSATNWRVFSSVNRRGICNAVKNATKY